MKKLILLLTVVVAFLTTSCSQEFYCKRCPTTVIHTVELKDTVIIKEILKDTTITVILPADSVITVLIVECDSMGLAQMKEHVIKSKNMVARLKIENGKLTQNITHLLDSLEVTIQYKETEITNLKSKIETLKETKEKQIKYIPKWVKALAVVGGGSILMLLLVIAYNLNRLPRFIRGKP